MTVEEIARKLAYCLYLKLKEEREETDSFTYEHYYARNKHYFLEQARIYLTVAQCLEAEDAACVLSEKRTEERTQLNAAVYYVPLAKKSKNGKSWGVTVDISNAGLSLYTDHELAEGSQCKIQNEGLWDNARAYRLIWCHKVHNDLYRCGFSLQT